MSTLIISLPTQALQADTELRYLLSADGHRATHDGSCTAALLPAPGRTGETVAVVPVRLLSWQRVTLPAGALAQTQRLRAVLEGLLEEQLLDDPAALHFALQPAPVTGAPIWVAVCERAWLRGALQLLESAGHRVDRVVPAWAPGPTASGVPECTVIGTPEDACAVLTGVGEQQAVALLPLASPAVATMLTPGTPLRAEPAVAQLAERQFARPVTLLPLEQGLLAAARGPWELAQLEFANRRGQRALRWFGAGAGALARAPEWRAARWALALLVLVQIGALNLWAWQDGRLLQRQQAAVRGVLTQAFPQVKLVVDAPVQMQREVALLRQQAGGRTETDFEALLSTLASALSEGQAPAQIDYGDGELRLRGLALAPEQQAALAPRLAARGLASRVQDGALVLHAASGAAR